MLEMCINMLPQHSVIFNGCDISNTNFLNKICSTYCFVVFQNVSFFLLLELSIWRFSFIKKSTILRFRQRIFYMHKEAISAQDKKLIAI